MNNNLLSKTAIILGSISIIIFLILLFLLPLENARSIVKLPIFIATLSFSFSLLFMIISLSSDESKKLKIVGLIINIGVILVIILVVNIQPYVGPSERPDIDFRIKAQLKCTELDYEIIDVNCGDNSATITVNSRSGIDIDEFAFRFFYEDDRVNLKNKLRLGLNKDEPLKAFNTGKYEINELEEGNLMKIEAIPSIKIENSTINCSQLIKEFNIEKKCVIG